jgi:hypothetical protein
MWINFRAYGARPRDMYLRPAKFAVRVFLGGVNGASGEPIKANMATILKRLNGVEKSQDYPLVRDGDNPAPR